MQKIIFFEKNNKNPNRFVSIGERYALFKQTFPMDFAAVILYRTNMDIFDCFINSSHENRYAQMFELTD